MTAHELMLVPGLLARVSGRAHPEVLVRYLVLKCDGKSERMEYARAAESQQKRAVSEE
jgi:hypothetical protein